MAPQPQPLVRTYKQFFFTKGLNTKTLPEALEIGALHVLENARIDKYGAIEKCRGWTAMGTQIRFPRSTAPEALPQLRKFLTINDAIFAVGVNDHASNPSLPTEDRLLAYDQIGWADLGGCSSPILETYPAGNDARGIISTLRVDCAVGFNYICTVREIYNNVDESFEKLSISLIDAVTLEPVVSQLIDIAGAGDFGGSTPRVVWVPSATSFYIFGVSAPSASDHKLWYIAVGDDTGTIGPATTVFTDVAGGTPLYDVIVQTVASVDSIYIAYKQQSTNHVVLKQLDNTLSVLNTATVGTIVPTTLITLFNSGTDICVLAGDNSNLYAASYGLTLLVVKAVFTFAAIKADQAWGSSNVVNSRNAVYYRENSDSVIHVGYWAHSSATITVKDFNPLGGDFRIVSRPFTQNSMDHIFIMLADDNTEQSSLFLFAFDSTLSTASDFFYQLQGRLLYGLMNVPFFRPCAAVMPFPTNSQKFITAVIRNSNDTDISGLPASYPTLAVVDFDSQQAYSFKSVGPQALVTGGMLQAFDGQLLAENNFAVFPGLVSGLSSTTGGSMTSSGVYEYCVLLEWIDAKGIRHRSSPSIAKSITLGASDTKVVFGGQNCYFEFLTGAKAVALTQGSLLVQLYRTTAGGSTFFFQGSYTPTDWAAGFSDSLSDADIAVEQVLYTAGGILANDATNSARAITIWKDRAWAIVDDEIHYSKEFAVGEAINFSEFLVLPTAPTKGRYTAIAALQDKLIIFEKGQISYVTGDGPNDTGRGAFYPIPQLLSRNIGCESQTSIVETGSAVMFHSGSQYWQIDASLSITPVGQELDYFLSPDVGINSTLINNDANEIRLQTNNEMFVHNQLSQMWSRNTVGAGSSMALANGIPAIINGNGLPYVEDPNNYLDTNGSPIQLRVVTGWIRLDVIAGYQRVWKAFIIGRYYSPHDLIVNVFYDYLPRIETRFRFAANEISEVSNLALFGDVSIFEEFYDGSGDPYCIKVPLAIQKCRAIRFEIYDTNQQVSSNEQNNYRSLDLISIGLELGLKKTSAVVPASKVAGKFTD